jgi:hypothetical protein
MSPPPLETRIEVMVSYLLNSIVNSIARSFIAAVSLPDGSLLVLGGYSGEVLMKDVWKSPDGGATWSLMTADAPWTGQFRFNPTIIHYRRFVRS